MRLTEESIRRRISEQLRPRRAGPGGNHETASSREAGTAETAPGQSVDVSDLYGIDDHESFLREAYRRILGREVDVYGFVHFREMLRNRFPKEAVVRSLVTSEEARKAGRRFVGLRSFRAATGGGWFKVGGRLRALGARLLLRTRNLIEILMQGWRFELLEVKMDLLQEKLMTEFSRSIHRAVETLWQLSEKMDKYASDLGDRQQAALAELEGRTGARFAAVQARLESLAEQVGGSEAALRELHRELACTRGGLEARISRLQQTGDGGLRRTEGRLITSQQQVVREATEQLAHQLSSQQEFVREATEQVAHQLSSQQQVVREATEQVAHRLSSQQEVVREATEQLAHRLSSQQEVFREATEQLAHQLSSHAAESRLGHESLGTATDHRTEEVKTSLTAVNRSVEAGLGRLEGRIRPAVVHSGSDVIVTELDGLIIGVPGEEWRMAAYHVFRGALEPGLVRAFKETVQPGMVVVDGGANIGMYTLLAARIVGISGKVLSFEPAPRARSVLRGNVQVNGFLESNIIEMRSEALSDRPGTANFTVYPGESGHSTLFGEPADGEKIQVATETLDNALALLPRVDVVKIDAEGAEPLILRGMSATLQRCPRLELFMEFSPLLLRRAGVDPADFLQELRQMDMEILLVDALTGERRSVPAEQLLGCYSENLSLHRQRRESRA